MTRRRTAILVTALLVLGAAACEPDDIQRLVDAAGTTTTTVDPPTGTTSTDTPPLPTDPPGTTVPPTEPTTSQPPPTTPPTTPAPTTTPETPPTTPAAAWWQPHGHIDWQIQLAGTIDLTVHADLYDIDGDKAPAATVQKIHTAGARALCYFDAGSIENYRADYAAFPKGALSAPNPEWPDEQWLDVRHLDDLTGPTGRTARELMTARIDVCKAKGFDGIDPDMTEVHTATESFPAGGRPSAADNIAYVRWLADMAHARGMVISLKGDVGQAAELEPAVDMTINEQCGQYDECRLLQPFADADKPILHIEYRAGQCPYTGLLAAAMSSIRKPLDLTVARYPC